MRRFFMGGGLNFELKVQDLEEKKPDFSQVHE
jgi:hypothetical protein